MSAGTARTYRSYRKRIAAKWGPRSPLEPTATEVETFREEIKTNAVVRRNSRGGRNTAENFIAARRDLWIGDHVVRDAFGCVSRGRSCDPVGRR